jgi:hypothetical protein
MMRKIVGLIVLGGMLFFLNADNINEPSPIHSQRDTLLLYENFFDTIFPPPGWQRIILVGSYNWQRYESPIPGMAMAVYPSFSASPGSMARLITRPINVDTSPTICTLKFLMMHDPGYTAAMDSLKIEYSTDGWTFTRVIAFNRYAPTQGLVQHSVYLGIFSGTFYVGFLGFSGHGDNIYIDDVSVIGNTYVPPQNDVGIDTIISPGATHRVNTPMIVIARLRRYSGGGPPSFPVVCSIVSSTGYLRYTNTQTVFWQEPLDTTRVSFTSWTPTVTELCTVKVRIIYPDSNPLNNRKTRTTLIYSGMLYEDFNDIAFPPPGWQAVIGSGTYNWQRSTVGSYPTCVPYEGPGMATYPSWNASSGNWARLISPPIAVFGTTQGWLKFWMMHDPGYSTAPDSIRIETSTNGTTFTEVAAIRRYASTQEWTQHLVYLGEFTSDFYIAFNALSGYGNNMFIDWVRLVPPPIYDVGVDSIISPQATHQVNTTMVPIARVKNYTMYPQSNFPVVCSIIGADGTLRYTNTQYVSSLAPNETTRVNFSAWVPNVLERCTVKMRTNLSGDENPLNDRKVRTTLIQSDLLIEGFNDPTFPPPGWQLLTPGIFYWERRTSNTNPTCTPYEGAAMMSYPSFISSPGNMSLIISPAIVLGSTPTLCSLKFMMYHDDGYPGGAQGPDSVKIEYSVDHNSFVRVAAFRRYEPVNGWVEHTVYLGTFTDSIYVGILAFSEYGNNMNIDYIRLLGRISGINEGTLTNLVVTQLNTSKPNPITNGLTYLSFSLAEPSQVALRIFDASGRLVKTLVNEYKNSGVYDINWNCRDDYSRKVAEGVYFYKLETPNQTFTKKLVLMKYKLTTEAQND